MLTIAAMPMKSRIAAVISVNETGKWLCAWMRPSAARAALAAQLHHELHVIDDADRPP